MTHETDEDLSALIDGELPEDAAARVRAHTALCAECAARLDRLGAASVLFKRSGERPVPAGLIARIRAKLWPRESKVNALELALMLVTVLGVVLVSGAMLKKFMPSLFNNIQQEITGAAGQMGGS